MLDHSPPPPRLSRAQRLWLLEIGLDRPMLTRLMAKGPQRPAEHAVASSRPAKPSVVPERADDVPSADGPAHISEALAVLRRGRSPVAERPASAVGPTQAPSPATAPAATETPGVPAVPPDWAALEAQIQECQTCELHAGRNRAVAGAGATQAVDWLVVGEAPGERDDRLGQPFQGKAGELLHAMLRAAAIDPQGAVFYTNLVKCRPRSNRLPTPEEIAACLPHLHSQIALLQPRAILILGKLAAQALLGDGNADAKSFEALRGQVHQYHAANGRAIPVVVTYHPASLLSRPRHKAASWRDLNLARDVARG